jgi:hypothetical protein
VPNLNLLGQRIIKFQLGHRRIKLQLGYFYVRICVFWSVINSCAPPPVKKHGTPKTMATVNNLATPDRSLPFSLAYSSANSSFGASPLRYWQCLPSYCWSHLQPACFAPFRTILRHCPPLVQKAKSLTATPCSQADECGCSYCSPAKVDSPTAVVQSHL